MTRPYPVHFYQSYLLSRRTIMRFYFLLPEADAVQIYAYTLGLAAEDVEGIEFHAAVLMSNHSHEVIFDAKALRSDFLARKNGLMARAFNKLRGRRGTFWDATSQRDKEPLLEQASVLAAIVYVICNPVRAGICDWPHEWPGSLGDWRRILSVPIRVERPLTFYTPKDPAMGGCPERIEFSFTQPKCFEDRTPEAYEALIREAVEEECLRIHAQRTGPAQGVRAALALSPDHRPSTPDDPNPEPYRFIGDPDLVKRLLEEWIAFVAAYLAMRKRWARGERGDHICFPPGTDRYRREEDAPVAPLGTDSPYAAFFPT